MIPATNAITAAAATGPVTADSTLFSGFCFTVKYKNQINSLTCLKQ